MSVYAMIANGGVSSALTIASMKSLQSLGPFDQDDLGLKLIKKRTQMERTGRREMTDAENRRHYLFSSMHA